nr:uncharacterized protein LOC113818246 [Penaeus vannamei]
MSQRETMVNTKLQCVLHHLTSYEPQEDGTSDGTLAMVEDDTVLHKLHSHIDLMLDRGGGGGNSGYEWAQNVGLMNFVQTVLDPSIVSNPKNTGTVAFAIKILASVIKYGETIETFSEDKILVHFLVILPSIRNDPSLASASLTLVKALIKDKAGLHWIIKNGLWEKMLLPCLRSPSMFVQREGVDLITEVMLLQIDTPHFSAMVKDLLIISDKFCELRQHVNGVLSEEIRQSNICVLNIFKQIFLQTLGKAAVYSQLRNVGDISTRLLSIIKHKVPVTSVTRASDVLILNLLHRFQEKLMGYGIFEQFLLDSLCADILSLTKLLLENGYIESFLRSSVNAHKYWRILVNNLKESKNIDITSVESILIIITGFQLTPIVSLYRASLGPIFTACPEKEKVIAKWNEELHSRINIKEENKNETAKLEKQIQKILEKDPVEALRLTVLCISSIISAADHLHLTTAVTVFQGLSFILISHNYSTSPMSEHDGLQRAVIDGLRILVEKYNIDWRKSYVSVCLMGQLCELVKIPGISTQVKVAILKAMNSCINGFIPPVMSMLVNSERMEENSVELMGKILTIYLGDTEWEVRDSALELLLTCMKIAKEKYPYFVEWLLRYRLNDSLGWPLRRAAAGAQAESGPAQRADFVAAQKVLFSASNIPVLQKKIPLQRGIMGLVTTQPTSRTPIIVAALFPGGYKISVWGWPGICPLCRPLSETESEPKLRSNVTLIYISLYTSFMIATVQHITDVLNRNQHHHSAMNLQPKKLSLGKEAFHTKYAPPKERKSNTMSSMVIKTNLYKSRGHGMKSVIGCFYNPQVVLLLYAGIKKQNLLGINSYTSIKVIVFPSEKVWSGLE